MGKYFGISVIMVILILSGCQEEINSPGEKNKFDGKWICGFNYISVTQIGGDIPDTLLSILEFNKDSFSVNIVKPQLNSDGTFNNIIKQYYHGSYSVTADTIKFNISADLVYIDKFSFAFYKDSLKIDGATKPGSGSFVRVSAFLWNNSDNVVSGTFYRANK